jgi:nucleoside-diphosphate-sugar epimerase
LRNDEPNERVLVTGGAGFFGSDLIDRVLAQGHDVLCDDIPFAGPRRNSEQLHLHPRFAFVRQNVTCALCLEVDQIYNLVCLASPIHYQHDPEIEFRPMASDDSLNRQPDIGLAPTTLGWQPAVALDVGLRKTIGYFEAMVAGAVTSAAAGKPARRPQ